MSAVSKGYQMSKSEVDQMLGMIATTCDSSVYESFNSGLDGNAREWVDLSRKQQNFYWSMELRKAYGGMKCDAQGNIFATGPGGVCVIAPDGTLLGRFLTGDRTANLCFGGEDGQTLFVCVNHRIGMVRVLTKGIGW